jgi:hypothetical protein
MICSECQQCNDDRNFFCRHCIAGLKAQAESGERTIEQFESLRLLCENFIRGLSPLEDFNATLLGMKKILEMSILVSGSIQATPEVEEKTGIKIHLIMDGLQAFLNSVEALFSVSHSGDIQKVAQALAIAEAGAYKLDEGMKTVTQQLSSTAVQGNAFQSTWLDAARKNIPTKKAEIEP